MQVKAEPTEPCAVTLEITVDEEQVRRIFENVYKEFNRYVNVPGFRPGKAPLALLERFVDPEKVKDRALERIIQETYPKALEEEGIQPMRGYGPQLEPPELENNKPYTYKAVVPLEPEVVLGAYTGLTAKKPKLKITDEMVEQELENLRKEKTRLERVTGRGVEPNDVLVAQVRVVEEGEEEGENAPLPKRKVIMMGENIPGFDEALLGMQVGEERSFVLPYPEDYPVESKRGKKATYTVKLLDIHVRKLPELDDDFAKQYNFESLEELRNAIRAQLEQQADERGNAIAEQNLIAQILQNSTVKFPMVLVEEEVRERFERLSRDLQERRMTYEEFLKAIGKKAEEYQKQVTQEAIYRIMAVLALREISIEEGIQADEAQIDAAFDSMLEKGEITEELYEEFRNDPRRRLQVANALIEQRLHDFLFSHNTIEVVEMDELPQEEEEPSKDEPNETPAQQEGEE